MTRRHSPSLVLLCACITLMSAGHARAQLQVGAGLEYGIPFWQNGKQSDMQFSGEMVGANLWFEDRTTTERWYVNGALMVGEMDASTGNAVSSIAHWNAGGGYTRQFFTPGLYLGATWTVVDKVDITTEFLENNAPYYLLTSDLYASGWYEYPLSDRWSVIGAVDIALVSGVSEADSWGYNLNQTALEEGRFTHQNVEQLQDAYNFQNWQVLGFWQQFTCRTNLEVRFDNRLSAMYQWQIHSIPIVSGYPTVLGSHRFMIRYFFLSMHDGAGQ